MKYSTTILAAVIAVAMAGAFHAEAASLELPKEILGVWCSSDQPAEWESFPRSIDQRGCRKQSNKNPLNMITVKPGEYVYQFEPATNGYAYTCTYRVIKNKQYPDIEPFALVAADCKENAVGPRGFRCTWQERTTFWVGDDGLMVEQKWSVRKGNERCARAG